MNENERIVCEFLREIAPSREWRYLGEVEHYLIGELCDELNKQLNAENAKLRELVWDYEHCSMHADCDRCEYDGTTSTHCPLSPCFPDIDELRELGVEVDE